MHDALRMINATLAQFTWHGPAVVSQLDRFYVTASIKPESCNAKHLSVSDHSLADVTVAINHSKIFGPGYWKNNVTLYQRWSPRGRPWPRGHLLKSLALASKPQVLENWPVLGSRTALFFKQLKFRWKAPETSRKICEHFFCFPHLEHRRSQGEDGRGSAPFPNEISPMTKM